MNIKSKILYWTPKIIAIPLGVFFIVFGEFDDSPGAQGIGLILIVATFIIVFRDRNKK